MCEVVELCFCEEEEVEHCLREVCGRKTGLDVHYWRDGEAHLVDFERELWVAFGELHGLCFC